MMEDMARALLRHTLATVAYRGGKAIRGAPTSFAAFRVAEGTRTPAEILAHIGDLFDWALSLADGRQAWHDSTPLPWADESARFFAAKREDSRWRRTADGVAQYSFRTRFESISIHRPGGHKC